MVLLKKKNSPLKLYEDLKAQIKKGEIRRGEQLLSESALSLQYKLPLNFVRKALKRLADEDFIEKVSKKGNFVKGAPSRNKALNIVFLSPELNSYIDSLLNGMAPVFSGSGTKLTVKKGGYSLEEEKLVLDEILQSGVNGLIAHPIIDKSGMSNAEKYKELSKKMKLAFISTELPGVSADFISSDGYNGAYELTDYLLKSGHKNILFISPYLDKISAIQERIRGFYKAGADHGMNWNSSNKISLSLEYTLEEIAGILKENLRSDSPATAVIAGIEAVGIASVRAAYDAGLSIPKDLSITSFSNSENSQMTIPALTVAKELSGRAIGRRAAEMLLQKIENNSDAPQKYLAPIKLLYRDSVSAINQKSKGLK